MLTPLEAILSCECVVNFTAMFSYNLWILLAPMSLYIFMLTLCLHKIPYFFLQGDFVRKHEGAKLVAFCLANS